MYSQIYLERKLNTRSLLNEQDRVALFTHFGRPRTINARSEILLQSGDKRQAFLVVEGWACSYKIMPDGARQIIEIAIPGDILGMSTLQLRHSDLLAFAVTNIVVQDFTSVALEKLVTASPQTAMALLWNCALNESVTIEHLVDVGRRTAVQRVSHFLVELYERLAIVNLAIDGEFRCPLTQPQIADALGLTAIHLNRVLRSLRVDGLLTFHSGTVKLLNIDRLKHLSGFSTSYLDQPQSSRLRGEPEVQRISRSEPRSAPPGAIIGFKRSDTRHKRAAMP